MRYVKYMAVAGILTALSFAFQGPADLTGLAHSGHPFYVEASTTITYTFMGESGGYNVYRVTCYYAAETDEIAQFLDMFFQCDGRYMVYAKCTDCDLLWRTYSYNHYLPVDFTGCEYIQSWVDASAVFYNPQYQYDWSSETHTIAICQ